MKYITLGKYFQINFLLSQGTKTLLAHRRCQSDVGCLPPQRSFEPKAFKSFQKPRILRKRNIEQNMF